MEEGEHIYISRKLGLYTHHGIYIGSNKVVHFDRDQDKIVKISLKTFADGCKVHIKPRKKGWVSRSKIIKRAKENIGKTGYSLKKNNCEHFANWCTTNQAESNQGLAAKIWTKKDTKKSGRSSY